MKRRTQQHDPLEAGKNMSQGRARGERVGKIAEQDQLATICVARLPDNIKKAIQSYESEDLLSSTLFVRIVFKNGYKVDFRSDWRSFAAECVLVHDLPPVEID